MAIPPKDLEVIRRWADDRIPAGLRDRVGIDVEVDRHRVIIYECHPPWNDWMGERWTRVPVAQLRWVAARSEWSLYWIDSNGDFHVYDGFEPSSDVTAGLAEIDEDPTFIFWG